MNVSGTLVVAVAVLSGPLVAQETRPVPKDSFRVTVSGCTRGSVFTAGPRTEDQVGRLDITEGMHLVMNGPKKMLVDIKAHEASMIAITGLMKKGQYNQGGVSIGGGIRVTPGSPAGGGSRPANTIPSQTYIDVEGWTPVAGDCPSR